MDPVGRSPGASIPPRLPKHLQGASVRTGEYTRLVPGELVPGRASLYKVLKRFGEEGGMSAVFMVENLDTHQTQVLKAVMDVDHLRPDLQKVIPERFKDEIRVLSRINNPHVVKLLDIDPDSYKPQFYVMEYAMGGSLTSYLEKAKAEAEKGQTELDLNPYSRAAVIAQILDGLEAFAQVATSLFPGKGKFAHRDIKPDNIYVVIENGDVKSVKIADFGIVKLPNSSKTVTMEILGTPSYMAPELFSGGKLADQRSDVWALGTVLYWLMTGVEPFEYLQDSKYWESFVSQPEYYVKCLMQQLDPKVPPPMWKIIFTALTPKPEGRYQTYVDFHRALVDFVNSKK
jgi:serine/threonine protein kinase